MRVKRFPKYTMLQVTWHDIISDSSWLTKDEIDAAKTIEIKTVGYFLQNKKNELKVAHSITEDGDSDITVIPWNVINNIQILETT